MYTAGSLEKGKAGKKAVDAPGHNGASPLANTDAANSCGPTGRVLEVVMLGYGSMLWLEVISLI